MLRFLYETVPGRFLLRFLTMPGLSVCAGKYLDSPHSKWLIPFFVRQNHIDLSICEKETPAEFDSFNDCFCRKLKEGERPVEMDPDALVSPCDGLLTVYPISEDLVIPVKQSQYRISELLRSKNLAKRFEGGKCWVFRLCVDHYHRYGFPDSGSIDPAYEESRRIKGILHTVRPIALKNCPVFTENSREYVLLHTEHFGNVIQMEVGAMLVGKIHNHKQEKGAAFERGKEKGHFLYGGSTIILLTAKDQVDPVDAFTEETPVKYGQVIGRKS